MARTILVGPRGKNEALRQSIVEAGEMFHASKGDSGASRSMFGFEKFPTAINISYSNV